jgi:hypothetical protein
LVSPERCADARPVPFARRKMTRLGSYRRSDKDKIMPTLYVARSQSLQQWASDVGLTPHVYKLGVTDGPAEAAVESLNMTKHGGVSDWTLVKAQETESDEATVLVKVGRKGKLVDPAHYPRLAGAGGLVKVKLASV